MQRIAVPPGDGIGREVTAAAADVHAAIEACLAAPDTRARDLGGTADTADVVQALVAHLSR